jgi:hypothetical protein
MVEDRYQLTAIFLGVVLLPRPDQARELDAEPAAQSTIAA